MKNVLIEHGLDPGPKCGKGTWSDFLRIHADSLWQCDFFSKRIWTLKGPRQIFAPAFIHMATRRVFVTPGTFKPDADWMEQQARAFLDHSVQEQLPCEIVTRDYDGKFSKAFDQVFKERSIQVKPVGPQAPNMQAFIERWIQCLKHEALGHFIVMSEMHFDYTVSEYVQSYLDLRPHQSLGNALLPRPGGEPANVGTHNDECKTRWTATDSTNSVVKLRYEVTIRGLFRRRFAATYSLKTTLRDGSRFRAFLR